MLQPTHPPSCRLPDGAAADAISRSVIKKCLNVTEKKTNARGGSCGQKGVGGGEVTFPSSTTYVFFSLLLFQEKKLVVLLPHYFWPHGEKEKKTQMAGHFKCADLPLINGRKRSLD